MFSSEIFLYEKNDFDSRLNKENEIIKFFIGLKKSNLIDSEFEIFVMFLNKHKLILYVNKSFE